MQTFSFLIPTELKLVQDFLVNLDPQHLHHIQTGAHNRLCALEARCANIYNTSAVQTTETSQWWDMINLHYELIHQYHILLALLRYPSPTLDTSLYHGLPTRLRTHGIIRLLQYLLRRRPESHQHLEAFIQSSYSFCLQLLATAPSFKLRWMELLGDLAGYGVEIRFRQHDRDTWACIAIDWYHQVMLQQPWLGRLYYQTAHFSRALEGLCQLAKSLTCHDRFELAEDRLREYCSVLTQSHSRKRSADEGLAICLAAHWTDSLLEDDTISTHQSPLREALAILTCFPETFREYGGALAVAIIAACLDFGSPFNGVSNMYWWRSPRAQRSSSSLRFSGIRTESAKEFLSGCLRIALTPLLPVDSILVFVHIILVWTVTLEVVAVDTSLQFPLPDFCEELAQLMNQLHDHYPKETLVCIQNAATEGVMPQSFQQLPEDRLISGLVWDHLYFSPGPDLVEGSAHPMVLTLARIGRILWIAFWLSHRTAYLRYENDRFTASDHFRKDDEDKELEVEVKPSPETELACIES